ncbi:MAG: peptidylprolyl isomerase [bacterium]|nr:peptidylprolyl isomerase [bacterium]
MKVAKVAATAVHRAIPFRLLAAALAAVLILGGAGGLLLWWRSSQTVAVVNGQRITRAQLFDTMYARAGRDALDELVLKALVDQAARKAGVTASDAQIQERVQELVTRFGGEEAFESALLYYGLTRAALEDDIRLQVLAEAVVMQDVTFNESELRAIYEVNPDRFGLPERVRASHILVDTEAEAQDILSRLREGADFAALAVEFSLDGQSAVNGGDLGFFAFDDMLEEFSAVAFSLNPGELSGVVPSLYGHHVILVTGREPAQVLGFEEVRDEVLREAYRTTAEEALPDWMSALRYSADIQYRLPGSR